MHRPRRPTGPRHRCVLPGVQPVLQPDQRRGRCRVPGHRDRRHVEPGVNNSGHLDLEVRHAEPGRALRRPSRVPAGPDVPVPQTTCDTFIGWNMSFNDLGQILIQANLHGGEISYGVDSQRAAGLGSDQGTDRSRRGPVKTIEGAPGSVRTTRLFSVHPVHQHGRRLPQLWERPGRSACGPSSPKGARSRPSTLNCYPATAYGIDADGDGYGDRRHEGQRVQRRDAAGRVHRERHRLQRRGPAQSTRPTTRMPMGTAAATPYASVCAGATPPAGYVTKSNDCDDTHPTVYPGALDDAATASTTTATSRSTRDARIPGRRPAAWEPARAPASPSVSTAS